MPLLTTLDPSNISTITGSSSSANYNNSQAETTTPPNYDEIDPPPSYATLFPGNKNTDTESSSTVQPIAHTSNDNEATSTCITSQQVTDSFSNAQHQQPSAPILPSSSSTSN